MKTDSLIRLITTVVIAVLVMNLTACKKDDMLTIGASYRIKSGVFNEGTYQPNNPVRLDELYTNVFGEKYAKVNASVNWGVLKVNRELYNNIGDTSRVEWDVPQKDLEK